MSTPWITSPSDYPEIYDPTYPDSPAEDFDPDGPDYRDDGVMAMSTSEILRARKTSRCHSLLDKANSWDQLDADDARWAAFLTAELNVRFQADAFERIGCERLTPQDIAERACQRAGIPSVEPSGDEPGQTVERESSSLPQEHVTPTLSLGDLLRSYIRHPPQKRDNDYMQRVMLLAITSRLIKKFGPFHHIVMSVINAALLPRRTWDDLYSIIATDDQMFHEKLFDRIGDSDVRANLQVMWSAVNSG